MKHRMVRLNVYERKSATTCHVFKNIILVVFSIVPTVSVLVASAFVSGVLSTTTAAIVASIMWCVMKKRYKHPHQSTSGRGMQDDKSGAHELTSVVYDTPVLKDHQNQTIST